MTVRLARELADELEAVAEIDDRPVAEVIRTAVAEHIARRRDDAAFRARAKEMLDRNRRILDRLTKG